jgi:hypothetical protein
VPGSVGLDRSPLGAPSEDFLVVKASSLRGCRAGSGALEPLKPTEGFCPLMSRPMRDPVGGVVDSAALAGRR